MPPALAKSYGYCRTLARRAGNFYFAFWSLPRDQYWAMCALYGFARLVDDAGDDPTTTLSQRAAALNQWRTDLTAALAGETERHIVFPALVETVRKYQIPPEYLYSLIQGVELDLLPVSFASYADLSRYCYHVAGVIGLCCIHIWGFTDDRAREAAILCGDAFQLTNILRDLKEDGFNGRCYLPQEDLDQFNYSREDLAGEVRDERFIRLMTFEVQRARSLYGRGGEIIRYLSPAGRPIFDTMFKLYHGLLDEIERRNYDVFTRRVRLTTWKKVRLAFGGILQKWKTGWSSQSPFTPSAPS